MLDVCLSHAFA
ncbi:hypothetical protein O1C12_003530 [Vibrio cholerae]|nr:hypothetical protein [Vibrio cholerae]ELP6989835.1 hypothetical protein [Vibrio vulnificus]EGQ9647679.1 hypothetical protein [Vibrio cholerae]EGR2120188.1 hypothetical protein [Vibrio cholerae]EGR5123544.1 hypothetical protein [Vibrio cholerae]